jgi:NADPH-dependent glutamate synthase beta subunit-like oxidoreductase
MAISMPDHKSKMPTGAVMVVGGGIAGMQASLDLADQGFKVHLIEQKSAIGGKMAQLDKTFPTNDCAMCTISPKLVEAGRHPNIEIHTNTSVTDIFGEAGDFSVTVHHEPRYIDLEKCIACGDCAKVCPIIIPDKFNEGLNQRRAAFKLYPQAVPNAYAIEKRGIAPCRDACPAGQRAQGYIALVREGRWDDALRVIKMDNPFPGICGRICNHRCETACNRGLVDEPVNIRALKRFITDQVYANPRQEVEPAEIKYPDQRVAIIGAGPCGLTAAQDLAYAGYPVSIFEAMPVAGGMLRLGVPEYRLPSEIIEREVQDIVELGVELNLNTTVDNLDDLFAEGYSSVLIAVGAHEGIRLPIPGADLDGVLINTHFLRDVRLGKYDHDTGELGKDVWCWEAATWLLMSPAAQSGWAAKFPWPASKAERKCQLMNGRFEPLKKRASPYTLDGPSNKFYLMRLVTLIVSSACKSAPSPLMKPGACKSTRSRGQTTSLTATRSSSRSGSELVWLSSPMMQELV